MSDRTLRAGDVVEIKSASEILATLDEKSSLVALPFMPEMLQYLGRQFVVDKRAEKVCDTVQYTGSRRLPDTVLLENLRCDGSAHDGCQAECRIFWKAEWLRRVESAEASLARAANGEQAMALASIAAQNTKQTPPDEGQSATRYRCQATELFAASEQLSVKDPRPYLGELTSGNVGFLHFVRVMARAIVQETRRTLGLLPEIPLAGAAATSPTPSMSLGLREGERVRVKQPRDIAATLNAKGRNRGLWFDREMLAFCGRTFQVRRRIRQFINEATGQMVRLQSDCLTLEGVVCSGCNSTRRWFCPRAIYPFWRETWLERAASIAEAPVAQATTAEDAAP